MPAEVTQFLLSLDTNGSISWVHANYGAKWGRLCWIYGVAPLAIALQVSAAQTKCTGSGTSHDPTIAPVSAQYNFSLTTFSPSGKLVQIEYALAAVNAGATSLGIKATNGVVIATERKVHSLTIVRKLTVPLVLTRHWVVCSFAARVCLDGRTTFQNCSLLRWLVSWCSHDAEVLIRARCLPSSARQSR